MIIVYWKSETALESKHIMLCSHFVQQEKMQMVIYQRRKGVGELKSYHTSHIWQIVILQTNSKIGQTSVERRC